MSEEYRIPAGLIRAATLSGLSGRKLPDVDYTSWDSPQEALYVTAKPEIR
jgi:hypothetical protein